VQHVTLSAPAKINLFLNVGLTRPDGFHEILSLIQAVSLCDILTVARSSVDDTLALSGPFTSGLSVTENLVLQAVHELRKVVPTLPPVSIKLEKNIPHGSGLGGGSSDIATTLKAANILFSLELDSTALAGIASKISSDAPFFFSTGSALVSGRGEIIHPLSIPLDYWLAIVMPGATMSTREAYVALDSAGIPSLTLPKPAPIIATYSSLRLAVQLVGELRSCGNDFEGVFCRDSNIESGDTVKRAGVAGHLIGDTGRGDDIAAIRACLLEAGAKIVRLTGSGSAVYGIFTEPLTPATTAKLRRDGWQVFVTRPLRL